MMHETFVRTRFCETDALGHINNTSYFIYLEEARIEFFDLLGANMETQRWQFILASTKCDFMAQGYFKQNLVIQTWVSRVGTKSFTLNHKIKDTQTGKVIALGEAIVVYFNFDTQQSEPVPTELKEQLLEYHGAQAE